MESSKFMRLRSHVSLLLSALMLWTELPAKELQVICGTGRDDAREELFLHRQSRLSRNKLALRDASGPAGKDIGNIAVMYDSGGVIARRNPFNLASKGITFTPASGFTRYQFRTTDAVYEPAGEDGNLLNGLGDDDTRQVKLPFRFSFFGNAYNDVWVNSDGNLTFGAGDSESATKTVGLLTGGPPRIALLFTDLDPTRSQRGVYVLAEPTRFIVTWLNVPEFGTGRVPMTFQLRLYPDGRIEYAYQNANPRDAVVGISPGRAIGTAELVSFLQASPQEFSASVAERFTSTEALDTVLLSQRFYQTHDDAYDYLAVYNTQGISARSFAVATELTVRSKYRAGFGDTEVDFGSQYGSARRLQALLNMGPLSNYPSDPHARVPLRGSTGDTPVTVLAHEAGHLFLALASLRDPLDATVFPMLNSTFAHWSYNYNSDASLLEGNRIVDRGAGANPRFETVATVEGFSLMDRYLMGLIPADQVPAQFFVRRSGHLPDELPIRGAVFNGDRADFGIEDVIAAEGRRSPDHTVSQRAFRMAVILLVPEGTEPAAEVIAQMEQLRIEFEKFYPQAAGYELGMDTQLKKNVQLSIWPAAGMVDGASITATVSVDRPVASPLNIALKTSNAVVSMPASVTIPAGATQTAFSIRGLRVGVEQIVAEPADASYMVDEARLQVNSAAEVRLQVVGGDNQTVDAGALSQPVEIRATDINLIPYPGLTVRAAVNAGSTIEPSSAITDIDGIARFVWNPGAAAGPSLRASAIGTDATVTATALSRPAFQPGGVLNPASFEAGISPGSQAVIFGASLAAGRSGRTPLANWPSQLLGVQVLMNGISAPLRAVSDGRIDLLAPREIAGETAEVVVRTPLGDSSTVNVPVFSVQPGLFWNTETGEASAQVLGAVSPTSVTPAGRGETIEIFATGLGPVRTSEVSGLEETILPVVVLLNGMEVPATFSGLSPATPGLYRVTAVVPDEAPPGLVKMKLMVDGRSSNEANITIR